MGIPQVPDRIKEAPATVLRAVFAGAGQLLLAAEKIRARAVEQAIIQHSTAAAGKTAPRPASTGADGAGGGGTAPTATANLPASKPASAVQHASEVPPIPRYSELSVASLRARLRVLDEGTVTAMLAYEKVHAHRGPVIAMFERRLAKMRGQDG
jgi:hypothetical protein